jgi:hypothetical protein
MRSMNRNFATRCVSLLPIVLFSVYATAQANKYACTEANPATLCTAANTCGTASGTCSVDVKRTANAASSTPNIPNAKSGALFCVKAGAKVQWKSSGKDIGFVVDIGPVSPFVPAGAIMGGTDRPITVVAKTPGCYKYSAGACMSGAIYGMCGETNAELVVIP